MKRKLHSHQQDSLDLLLDTLCNVFGGIIMIACLLAMLSRPQVSKSTAEPEKPVDHESGIQMEKRIEMAQAELDGLEKLRAQLQSEDDPSLRPLITELAALKKTAEKLRQEKAKQDEMATIQAKEKVRDSGNEIARLREQEQELERKLGIANRSAEAAAQMRQALEKKLADLQLELENTSTLKIEKLRFPRERVLNKSASPIIIQYGQVFPLYDSSGKISPRVSQVLSVNGTFTAFAKQGEGLSPTANAPALREILKHLGSGGRYLTLYVYPDSYATLRELKKLIYELGVDYGMNLREEKSVLLFDPNGAKPAPL
jgi:hypothetical protein